MSQSDAMDAAQRQLESWANAHGVRWLRVVWIDLHGHARSKWLTPVSWARVWRDGVSMVSTLSLKDAADRTAWPVFAGERSAMPEGLLGAQNLLAVPRPESLRLLPWAPGHAWVMADLQHPDGQPLAFDARQVLLKASTDLAQRGWAMRVGLELEFHVYRVVCDGSRMSPRQAAWPAEAPEVEMLHPGYQLLSDAYADSNHEVMEIAAEVAAGLGLPLSSMEVEMGPSQFEAVFDAMDALAAADAMVAFRVALREALVRQGYHVTFMCRPPFDTIMSSGWHLHHSLVDAHGQNAFAPLSAQPHLSDLGQSWLAGLLRHASCLAAWGVPTTSGYARFAPNALAPQAAVWGVDNRGAMLRVVGQGAATRIENRVHEPAANPYLVMAAHIAAGLDGVDQGLRAPPACESPYASAAERLPADLNTALDALDQSQVMRAQMGGVVVDHYVHIKRAEAAQCNQADDRRAWEAKTYFSRL